MQLEVVAHICKSLMQDNCPKFEAILCYKVMRPYLRQNRNYSCEWRSDVNVDTSEHGAGVGNPR